MTRTRTLAGWALGTTILLVAVGGYTRGSGSGFGCADRWPLCEGGILGGLLPRAEFSMVVEWTHRWLAAVVGVLVIATAVSAVRRRPTSRRPAVPAVIAVAVVGIQAWLGRLIVTGGLDRDLVSLHLTVSMVVVALLVLVTVAASATHGEADRREAWMLGAAAVGAYGVLLLGSLVHDVFIEGWPLVRGDLVPDLSIRLVALHWGHRLAVAAVFGYLIFLAVRAQRSRVRAPHMVWWALGAYATNIGLGAAHVFTEVTSSFLVALHLLLAALVWAALVAATAEASGWGHAAGGPPRVPSRP